jgi:hypothetical protein
MNAETAAIGLNDQDTLARSLSPELMLVDAGLAERARQLLREPDERDGKGKHMSALGTHEFTAGTSLGLEPPLSPPVVRGPMSSALPADGGLSELPTPPPAIRPPESAIPAPAAVPAAPPAPAPQAEVPQQPEPAPAFEQPAPAMAPEPDVTVHDYFSAETPAPDTAPEPEPVVELAPVSEPVVEPEPAVEVHSIPLMAPEPSEPAPVPEPAAAEEELVELPTLAPMAPAPEQTPALEPVAAEPEPVLAPMTPEPVADVELPVVVEQPAAPAPEPVAEPALEVVPDTVPELEELFAPARATGFSVVVRLKDGEGLVEVGSFRDFGTAMEGAQEVIEQFSTATEGQWPFYAGRFIRPDLIVSVDVVEGEAA